MESIKTIYKIGHGPSSSHTMGPQKAAMYFKMRCPSATRYEVELYGSLAQTGRGHLTDEVISNTLGKSITKVIFKEDVLYDYHPNGMLFKAFKDDKEIDSYLVFSVGGGELRCLNDDRKECKQVVYKESNMQEVLDYCDKNNLSLIEYIKKNESKDIYLYLDKVFDVMIKSVERGIKKEGALPGKLKVKRRAKDIYEKYSTDKSFSTLLFASSLASSEENASGEEICIAPTCGSCGVVAGVLYTYYNYNHIEKQKLLDGLLIGGLIGNIIRTNASISGAEVGCQGEVGVACAMAAGMVCFLLGGSNKQIEYASEIALEHHLGLTCDPIDGYVQIPCIERNAMSAKRAIDSAMFSLLTSGEHYIKLDDAIKTMMETGKDLNSKYRETSKGGLANRVIC